MNDIRDYRNKVDIFDFPTPVGYLCTDLITRYCSMHATTSDGIPAEHLFHVNEKKCAGIQKTLRRGFTSITNLFFLVIVNFLLVDVIIGDLRHLIYVMTAGASFSIVFISPPEGFIGFFIRSNIIIVKCRHRGSPLQML